MPASNATHTDLAYADTLWKSADALRGQVDGAMQSEPFMEAHGEQKIGILIFGLESSPTTWRLAQMKRPIQRCDLSSTSK